MGSTHTRLVALLSVAIVIVMLGIAATLDRRQRYNEEIGRLRAAMTEVERERTDALLAEEAHRFDVSLALLRRQARLDGRLHLAVDVEAGNLVLQRDGAVLRTVDVEFGSQAPDTVDGGEAGNVSNGGLAGSLPVSTPLGTRTVERVIPQGDAYPLPSWMLAGHAWLPPDARLESGVIVLAGGQLFYAEPASGPLAPPAPVLPGSARIPAEDFAAMRESITPGMTVYFH